MHQQLVALGHNGFKLGEHQVQLVNIIAQPVDNMLLQHFKHTMLTIDKV